MRFQTHEHPGTGRLSVSHTNRSNPLPVAQQLNAQQLRNQIQIKNKSLYLTEI